MEKLPILVLISPKFGLYCGKASQSRDTLVLETRQSRVSTVQRAEAVLVFREGQNVGRL
ncbi:hypothetical protein MA16_Dca009733 [Dendrobium catenatum]|uniref:Uncharacterized protein n=1 Tax=Dendrobium catenatum TaxID=906689 RepID=A0A2I0VQK9_9ASPA|nr:hypothetical protein MA16_Dca009733 [Dendrobium catenatum]